MEHVFSCVTHRAWAIEPGVSGRFEGGIHLGGGPKTSQGLYDRFSRPR